MLNIKFSVAPGKLGFSKERDEYVYIWKKEGEEIVDMLENLSGLRFKVKKLAAIVSESSISHPLTLKGNINKERKLATLIHELIHILFWDNKVKYAGKEEYSLEVHKLVYLFQYEVLISLCGRSFADRNAKADVKYRPKMHGLAWNWALSLGDEERKLYLEKYLKV